MKKFIISMLFALGLGSAVAAETYTWVIPTAPGTVSDLVNRAIATEYEKISGNRIDVENRPGGDFIVGIQRFKSCSGTCIIGTGSAVQVVNPFLKKDWPFSDKDFDHVGFVGWIPNVFYVKADSKIRNLGDVKALAESKGQFKVAISDTVAALNVIAVHNKYQNKDQFTTVKYKTSVQALQDVISGQVDAALASPGEAIIGAQASGQIRIIGSSHEKPIVIAGTNIPAMNSALGIKTFAASQVISITPGRPAADVAKLKADLLAAIRSEAVAKTLMKANIQTDGGDGVYSNKVIADYKQRVGAFVDNLPKN